MQACMVAVSKIWMVISSSWLTWIWRYDDRFVPGRGEIEGKGKITFHGESIEANGANDSIDRGEQSHV
jgi:hypothetical protein